MSDYFLAPAAKVLWDEVRGGRFPGRDEASDGWIGDSSHQSRKSDHNPAWDEPSPFYGIVRAVDLDVDGWPSTEFRDYLIARCRSGVEARVQYVINDRRIWSRTYDWAERAYTGDNPHTSHIHISLRHDQSNFDEAPWLADFQQDELTEPPAPPPESEEDTMGHIVNLGDVEPGQSRTFVVPTPGNPYVKIGPAWLSMAWGDNQTDETLPVSGKQFRGPDDTQTTGLWGSVGSWGDAHRDLPPRARASIQLVAGCTAVLVHNGSGEADESGAIVGGHPVNVQLEIAPAA